MKELAHLGSRLRVARQSKSLTLDELASAAGMSPSTLSRLESGKRQASLELLIPLTRELGLSIEDLIAPPKVDPRIRRTTTHRPGMTVQPLSPENSAHQVYKVTYTPGAPLPAPRIHTGYEWLYVVSGTLKLWLDGTELLLTPGEAAEFDTRTPHLMSAHGTEPAEIVSIFNGDGLKMHLHSEPAD